MDGNEMKTIVESYIKAYNNFDVEGMTRHMHEEVEFRNVSGGEVTHAIKGIEGFKLQAQEATHYFTEREQRITELKLFENKAEASIDYTGVLAMDLPDELKASDKLELKGKSVFTFEDGKIIRLEDFS